MSAGEQEQILEQTTEDIRRGLPVRGTQSFVSVMAEVFKRPSLTGLEALWRWVFWVTVLCGRPVRALYATVMQVITAFQAGGFPALGSVFAAYPAAVRELLGRSSGLLLLVVGLWVVLAALGRGLVLQRATPAWKPRFGAMLALATARWLSWAAALGLWFAGLRWSLAAFVTEPQSRGSEPAWVALCAALIAGTLLLFVLWLGTAWVFPLAEIYSAGGEPLSACLRAALAPGPLRGKLTEINLVIGIVKIALLVLAMVFSACPLPFETVETQSFLLTWTAGVLLLYFLASDYFHVVRVVAFARMRQALVPLPAAAPNAEAAS